ncbi:MAG: hypothetical protein ACFFDH_05780 [Promethearchaeota archaeon]
MIANANINNNYIGPKALFDPNFIPPSLLYRKKEEDSLYSILEDSISDEYPLNILYQGVSGIGKKAIVNKVLNDLLIENNKIIQINKVFVDCKEKKTEELIFSLLSEINIFSDFDIDFRLILKSNIAQLWNTFKFICDKVESPLFLIFNNMEYLEPKVFNKFLQFSRETNITLISTTNKIIKPATIDLISEFDFRNKLNFFTYHELYAILKQRALLCFSHEIDKDILRYITDLICEQYVPVPGKGIEILRDLYPILRDKNNHNKIELLEICQDNFENLQISDEFSMLNYLSEEDILSVIFLDNLSNYFITKTNYYISFKELKELFEITCETLEYEKDFNELAKLKQQLINFGILKPSKRTNQHVNLYNNYSDLNHNLFFILINPKQIKLIIDTIFNQ